MSLRDSESMASMFADKECHEGGVLRDSEHVLRFRRDQYLRDAQKPSTSREETPASGRRSSSSPGRSSGRRILEEPTIKIKSSGGVY